MIAAIYARKSTEQLGVSDEDKSVARQLEHARAFAAEKGWAVDERFIFVDDGISGATFDEDRPGLFRLLASLKPRPPFQVLAMADSTRLGREQIPTMHALLQIVDAGVAVWFYLERKQATLDGPLEQMMQSLSAFAAQMTREQARKYTKDALQRKFRAGYVTGGRCFGYANVEAINPASRKRSHVERRIVDAEAAVVRRIFQLCADGLGKARIAQRLNADGAPAPTSQRNRPRGWATTSVHEVLYREIYRGELVWNKTSTQRVRGKYRQVAMPESAWIRQPAPHLRIVPEDLWAAAHARLTESRGLYLRRTDGKLWGRPLSGSLDAKYLLTSMLQCGKCGGTLEVRSRSHGRRRVHFYECSTHRRRGTAICRGLDVPMAKLDDELLTKLERELLKPDVLRQACSRLIAETQAAAVQTHGTRDKLLARRSQLERELGRMADTLAGVDVAAPRAVLMAMKTRESEIARIERDLMSADQAPPAGTTAAAIAQRLDAALADWRALLRRHAPLARQLLRKIIQGPVIVTPEQQDEQPGYRVRGRATVEPLLTVELERVGVRTLDLQNREGRAQAVASPGIPSWNQIQEFLQEMRRLRESAIPAA